MFFRCLLIITFILFQSCGNDGNEKLVSDIIDAANRDITALEFIATDSDIVLSASATHVFTVLAINGKGASSVLSNDDLDWQISSGALSAINQSGLITTANVAETVAITASFGLFTASSNVRISDAKFDSVVSLDVSPSIELSACQNISLTPMGLYYDALSNQEIRPVDNNILPALTWAISDATSIPSVKAFIETNPRDINLFTLASGDIEITAAAFSDYSSVDKTSSPFTVTINDDLQDFKLCDASSTDLATCASLNDFSLEVDTTSKIISVGSYLSPVDASLQYENISRTTKWGTNTGGQIKLNHINSVTDGNHIFISASTADTVTNLSAACGTITNPVTTAVLPDGVILDEMIVCDSTDINCMSTSFNITVNEITVESLQVDYTTSLIATAISLIDNELENIPDRPEEIILSVIASLSNNTTLDVTNNPLTVYTLSSFGTDTILEEKTNETGVFTVINPGEVLIEVEYEGNSFLAKFEIL